MAAKEVSLDEFTELLAEGDWTIEGHSTSDTALLIIESKTNGERFKTPDLLDVQMAEVKIFMDIVSRMTGCRWVKTLIL